MCEASVYLLREGRESLVMEEVFICKPEDGRVLLENIFGEQKLVAGEIDHVSLMEHKIFLRSCSGPRSD